MRSTPARVKIDGLDGHLVAGADMHAAAGAGVFAFGVLADAEDVEVGPAQRALDAREQAVRADVGVLHEGLADRQQQAVQRDGVRHLGGPADRAEEDRVEAAQDVDPVGGHHGAGGEAGLAGPVEARDLQPRPTCRCDGEGGVGDVAADPVAGDRGDPVGLHASSPRMSISTLLERRLA